PGNEGVPPAARRESNLGHVPQVLLHIPPQSPQRRRRLSPNFHSVAKSSLEFSPTNGCSFHIRRVKKIGISSQGRFSPTTRGRCAVACGPANSSPRITVTPINIIPE